MLYVVTLAVVLIVIAIAMFALGVFVQGAHLLFWLGIIIGIAAVVIYIVDGSRRSGPRL